MLRGGWEAWEETSGEVPSAWRPVTVQISGGGQLHRDAVEVVRVLPGPGRASAEAARKEKLAEVYGLPLWLLGPLRVGWPEFCSRPHTAVWMTTSGHRASYSYG